MGGKSDSFEACLASYKKERSCQGSKVQERKAVHREADRAQRTLSRKTAIWIGSSLM